MAVKNKEKNAHPAFSEYQKQFLLEYFKEMRAEINLRIKNHSSLVWAKVVTTGALMSFLLAQEVEANIKISGLAFAPAIAILYDIMIAQNLRAVHRIGHFIRDNIENVLFTDFELWENYAGQKSIKERNYGSVDIFMLSTFTLGTMLTTVFLLWIQGYIMLAVIIAIVSLIVFILLYSFMSRYILYFHKK
jgi:hypothetical protein